MLLSSSVVRSENKYAQIMQGAKLSPASILVVDDESSICRLVATLLSAQGHKVAQAPGGAEALALANAQMEHFDLLVTDVRMHGMDGVRLAKELAARNPRLKIIFMSGFFDDQEERPEGVGADWQFIAKPFGLPDLLSTVNRVLKELEG
jgi:DNA-binding NtrC family response regulator